MGVGGIGTAGDAGDMGANIDDGQRPREQGAGMGRRRAFDLYFKRQSGRDAGDERGLAKHEEGRQIARMTLDIGPERKLRPDA